MRDGKRGENERGKETRRKIEQEREREKEERLAEPNGRVLSSSIEQQRERVHRK